MPDTRWPTWTSPVPKSRVYRFGAVWHWKCSKPSCQHGGRDRVWVRALDKALDHVASHSQPSSSR